MMSMSVVRRHFCTVVARVKPKSRTPRKTGLNCTMPALVSSSDGSSGTSDDDGHRRQPLLSKNERKLSRISAEFTLLSFPSKKEGTVGAPGARTTAPERAYP